MKKVSSFVLLFALLVILPISAKAEVRFTVECDKTSLARGESTICTYRMSKDAVDSATVTKLSATAETGDGLTIQGFEIGSLWVGSTTIADGTHQGDINLTSKDVNGISETHADIGILTVRLDPDATECGKVCINVKSYTQGGNEYTGNQECADFTIDGDPTAPTPDTGAFANYAVLIGGAVLGLTTMAVTRSKSKFYRI